MPKINRLTKLTLDGKDGDHATITMAQLTVLSAIRKEHPDMVWQPNLCGCCVSALTSDGDYLIGEDGDFDFFPPDEPYRPDAA